MNANVDASTMRRMNRATVLRIVRDMRTTSRIDIAQVTGLNKATVSNIVDELIADQFVHEVGYGSSSGGRKPILLRFNANAAYAVGVDVQLTRINTVVCNVRGEAAYRNLVELEPDLVQQDPQAYLSGLLEAEIARAIASAPRSAYGLLGICVGLPGMVNFHTGVVSYLPSLAIENWKLGAELTQRFELPVFCDNDANCGAWSETMGKTPRHANLAYVNAGAGIGVGLLVDGQLYRGHDGLAGEFGHMTINPMGPICKCGNSGCWEEYASERSLLRYLRESGADVDPALDSGPLMDWVIRQARSDNRAYIRAFHSLGQHLGVGIANILSALNPDEIIIGGSIASAATFVLPEIERVVKHRAVSRNKQIPIRMSHANAVAVGAACLVIDEVLFATPLELSLE